VPLRFCLLPVNTAVILLHTSGSNIKKYFNICIADDGRHSVAETVQKATLSFHTSGSNIKKYFNIRIADDGRHSVAETIQKATLSFYTLQEAT